MFHPIVIFAFVFFVAFFVDLNVVFLIMDLVRCIIEAESYGLPLLPNELKRASRMNWAGCIITSILLLALVPIPYILRAIVFLFHV